MRRCKLLSHAVKVFEVVVRGFIGPFRETSLLEMSKRNSAIAARWSGGRVTMGPAGRDRRVRGFPSKKRQPGRRSESPELDFLDEALVPADSSMAESKDEVPLVVRDYTEPSQRAESTTARPEARKKCDFVSHFLEKPVQFGWSLNV